MKFSKIFFFFTFFLTIKLLSPSWCKVSTAKLAKSSEGNRETLYKLEDDIRRKKKRDIILISSIASGVVLLLGAAIGLGVYMHKRKKGEPEKGNGGSGDGGSGDGGSGDDGSGNGGSGDDGSGNGGSGDGGDGKTYG